MTDTTIDPNVEPESVNTDVNTEVNDENTQTQFKLWEKKEEEPKETQIPYHRFKEVNDEKKAYAAKIEEIEAKLAKYAEREKEIDKIKTPEDIDITKYTDPNEYLKDLTKATKDQAIREVEERFLAREAQKAREEQQRIVVDAYTKNLTEAISRNPEIKYASDALDKYASQIHPDIAYELMIDENVGELVYDIATNQELLNEMFKSNPADFIRKLHKMSAKIDRATRYGSGDNSSSTDTTNVPVAIPKKTGLPTQVRGGAGASRDPYKEAAKLTNAEYRKLVSKKKKNS